MMNTVVSIVMMLWLSVASSDAFAPHRQQKHQQQRALPFVIRKAMDPIPLRSSPKLFFFGRNKNMESTEEAPTNPGVIMEAKNLPIQKDDLSEKASADLPPPSPSPLTGTEEAARLRAEAVRARLEAERMDAELTFRKIERLEKELSVVTADASATTAATDGSLPEKKRAKSSEDLQRELDALLTKVRGAKTQPISSLSTSSISAVAETEKSATNPTPGTESSFRATASVSNKFEKLLWPKCVMPYDEEQYKELYNEWKDVPQFMLATVVPEVEMEIETDPETGKSSVNVTELVDRLDKRRRGDFSYSSKEPPTFTPQQIAEMEAELTSDATTEQKEGSWWGGVDSPFSADEDNFLYEAYVRFVLGNDQKALAKLKLEYFYYVKSDDTKEFGYIGDAETAKKIARMAAEEPWLKPVFGRFANVTTISGKDNIISGLYPKCTTKFEAQEGELMPPTEAQVRQLIADILPKANFKSTSKPEAVLGGFIVRGTTSLGGDAFIAKLDAEMERSNLKDKMTVLYTQDFTVYGIDFTPDMDDEAPILYIVGPDLCRTAKPVANSLVLSVVSAFGLATSWYLSVYPFLLNPVIAARVDEQLAIADANMLADLAWLTDLSIPLFATFMGIQLIHELGHLVVAGANGIKTSSPTFVPSVLTGITSSVTTFKSPPKNLAAMFDYAVAGPLAGMAASLLAIAVGSQLTTITDPSLFPAFPLEFLRQSTLGGGIIELVLGDGTLYVPQGALGTAAVAELTVPLHPIAIAGYVSMIVNALAILPVGTTDGGRVALALYGRPGKVLIGSFFFIGMIVYGWFGSDILLFYSAFCLAFQGGNELPARNEVDKLDMDLPRCFVAFSLVFLALLAIKPF